MMIGARQPPNTRVQRTRSSASPPRSPLTRHPLGRANAPIVALTIVLITLVSLTDTGAAAEPEVPLPNDLVVALIRGRCYGPCPVYEVTVFESGRVQFIPGHATTLKDRKSWHISRDAVAEIRGLLDKSGVLRLKDQYDTDTVCPELWSDNPSVYLTIHHEGTWKFIHHDLGCRGSAEVSKLETLEKAIDRISGVENATR